MIACDLETYLIRPGLLTPKIVCGSFAEEPVMGVSRGPYLELRETAINIASNLISRKCELAGANIAFDFGCLLAADPSLFPAIWKLYEEGKVWDVQIAQTLVAIAEGRLQDGFIFTREGTKLKSNGKITNRYSLASCVSEVLGRDDAKRNDVYRLRYSEFDNLPLDQWPEEARQYPLDDAQNTLGVALAQRNSGFDFRNLPSQCFAAFCLHLSAINGLRTNGRQVRVLRDVLETKLAEIRHWATSENLLRTDGTKDTKLIKSLIEADYGEAPKTAGGGVSMSRDTLSHARSPILKKFSEISKLEKLATYLPTLEEASNTPLNTRYNVLLSTGRASSESMIQLLPRKGGVRECFEARGIYSSCDYPAVELTTLAQVCLWSVKYSQLAKAINEGMDAHCLLASKMVGMQYDDFKSRYENDEQLNDIRQAAKAGNFGYPGMMGAVKFVEAKLNEGSSVCQWMNKRDNRCGETKAKEHRGVLLKTPLCERCIECAQRLRQFYLETWPEIRTYWQWITAELQSKGEKITQFVSGRVRGGLHAPAAANTLFQGLAADAAKLAVINMTKEMYLVSSSPLYGSRLAVFAHDETIIDSPPERAGVAALRQAEIMREALQLYVPDIKVGKLKPVLMKNWFKGAKQKFNESGELIPWAPTES